MVEAVAGLGKQFLNKLVAAWEEQGSRSELMGAKVFLALTKAFYVMMIYYTCSQEQLF